MNPYLVHFPSVHRLQAAERIAAALPALEQLGAVRLEPARRPLPGSTVDRIFWEDGQLSIQRGRTRGKACAAAAFHAAGVAGPAAPTAEELARRLRRLVVDLPQAPAEPLWRRRFAEGETLVHLGLDELFEDAWHCASIVLGTSARTPLIVATVAGEPFQRSFGDLGEGGIAEALRVRLTDDREHVYGIVDRAGLALRVGPPPELRMHRDGSVRNRLDATAAAWPLRRHRPFLSLADA